MWPWVSVLLALLGVGTAAAAQPSSTAQTGDAAVVEAESTIGIVVVDSASVGDALIDELGFRLPGRRIVASGDLGDPPAERFAWIGVTPHGEGALLEVVLSDGRAYSRAIEVPAPQLDRALAGGLANMLDAIEHGRLAPERTGVEVPLPPVATTETPALRPNPASRVSDSPPIIPAEPTVRWWWGPRSSAVAAFGVGPPAAEGGFVAGGASVGLDAMHRRGGALGVELRVAGRQWGALQLVRVRVAMSGGYVVRRGRFAMPVRAGVSIEPAMARGARLGDPEGGSESPAPLVGALLHAAPGVVWWLRSDRVAVRAFVDLELAGSMEAAARPGVLRYVEDGDARRGLGRAGGLELGAGVGIGGWFAVRPPSP